jgi:hypothetical protein
MSSLPIFFYGTLSALAWRLSKAMPFALAVAAALTIAVVVTAIMSVSIQF